MPDPSGLRERKKQQTRHRLADVAARLFAERGYDAVAIADVAVAAEVSEQTVYNYFPTKPELVLDRADEIRERYRRVVLDRVEGETPADALRVLVHGDIDRFLTSDPALARGEFPAQCLQSAVLRRFALETREDQAQTIASAIVETAPGVHPLVAHAHAAALVAVVQSIADRIGAAVLEDVPPGPVAVGMHRDADAAFDDAVQHFRATTARIHE